MDFLENGVPDVDIGYHPFDDVLSFCDGFQQDGKKIMNLFKWSLF